MSLDGAADRFDLVAAAVRSEGPHPVCASSASCGRPAVAGSGGLGATAVTVAVLRQS